MKRRMNYSAKRMLVAGSLVLTFWGSPLLALTTWLGLVDPAKI